MQKKYKISLWIALAAVAVVLLVVVIVHQLHKPITLTGTVIIQDKDFTKELPIADVEIVATRGTANASTKSEANGLFALKLRKWVRTGQPITLKFRHPNYQPLDLKDVVEDKLYIVRMLPITKSTPKGPAVEIGNVRVRYSIKAQQTMNVGSAVRTFQVENAGNVPCNGKPPCSPDGKWKATIGSTTFDAGVGNEFRNARISCIAGPCPFTKIESQDLSKPSQKITVSARNWSDTVTFLLEADVVHVMQSDLDHQAYPVIFGSALNFTLPADAEGVSLQADMAGETIIFPLGPSLFLSWAKCDAEPNRAKTYMYRCELKAGYRFQ